MNPHRPLYCMSLILACVLSCTFLASPLHAQIANFPLDNQLYPRNLSTNKGSVKVSGKVAQTTNYRQMRLYVYRDGNWINSYTVNLTYSNGVASYNFTVQIPAERNNYRFSLYGATRWSENHLRTANNVVAGDAYIIQGQSNAVANMRGSGYTENNADDPTNAPFRNFVRVYGNGSATMSYTKGWFIGRGNVWYDVDGHIGQWGMRLGSYLVGATNVPVAIINGAIPGVPLSNFQRNDTNPTATNTNYGRLLRRIEEAGLKSKIRALFWYQGESDNQGYLSSVQLTTQQYKDGFSSLQEDWKADYPGLNKFYIVQIRHGCGIATPDNTLKIQEAQRQLDKESSEILTISTNNTNQLFESTGIGFCHYNFVDGYRNIGDWLSRIILRDLFLQSFSPAIESPEPESAVFSSFNSSGAATQVAILLKDQQAGFSLEGNIASDFRLDGGSYTISSVSLSNRTVYINFSRNTGTANNPSSVSYKSHDGAAAPIIRNTMGMGLIHFENLTIQPGTPPPPVRTVCPDNFEPNNSINEAKPIPHDTNLSGSMASSTDEDWYSFRTWNFPYFKISIWNLAGDYDLYLYNTNGVLLASSVNTGNTAEVINYNGGQANTFYRIRVVSKNGSVNPAVCYNLRAGAYSSPLSPSSPPFGSSANLTEVEPVMETNASQITAMEGLKLYPNPVSNYLIVEFQAVANSKTTFSIVDMAGRIWVAKEEKLNTGPIQYRLSLPKLPRGNYVLKINHGDMIINRKLIATYQ